MRWGTAWSKRKLHIDDYIITGTPDLFAKLPPVAVFFMLFIPHPHFSDKGMMRQQRLVAFAQQKIKLPVGMCGMQLFHNSSSQHHIAQESRLNDQASFHNADKTKK